MRKEYKNISLLNLRSSYRSTRKYMFVLKIFMEPFYFKSFEKVIGIACDVPGLYYSIMCLSKYDKAAVEYHLKQGHIADWLNYLGEHELSQLIRKINSVEDVIKILETYLQKYGTKKIKEKRLRRQHVMP